MRPIVIENVTTEMDIYHQESFGPTVSLIVVESEEEAVELANDTEYGLSAAVFTRDLAAGLRVAKQIDSGYGRLSLSWISFLPPLSCLLNFLLFPFFRYFFSVL